MGAREGQGLTPDHPRAKSQTPGLLATRQLLHPWTLLWADRLPQCCYDSDQAERRASILWTHGVRSLKPQQHVKVPNRKSTSQGGSDGPVSLVTGQHPPCSAPRPRSGSLASAGRRGAFIPWSLAADRQELDGGEGSGHQGPQLHHEVIPLAVVSVSCLATASGRWWH